MGLALSPPQGDLRFCSLLLQRTCPGGTVHQLSGGNRSQINPPSPLQRTCLRTARCFSGGKRIVLDAPPRFIGVDTRRGPLTGRRGCQHLDYSSPRRGRQLFATRLEPCERGTKNAPSPQTGAPARRRRPPHRINSGTRTLDLVISCSS